MAVSDTDIDRVKKHLGRSLRANDVADVMAPYSDATVEDACHQLTTQGEVELAKILQTLDGLETHLIDAQVFLVATSVGKIGINTNNAPDLWVEYLKWVKRLALLLHLPYHPGLEELAGTSVNVEVLI